MTYGKLCFDFCSFLSLPQRKKIIKCREKREEILNVYYKVHSSKRFYIEENGCHAIKLMHLITKLKGCRYCHL